MGALKGDAEGFPRQGQERSAAGIQVGIFWWVDDVIVADAARLADAEPYGEALQFGEHYRFWENLTARSSAERRLQAHAYDYYPRGRVVCFPKRGTFILYADPCLTPDDLGRIIKRFNLDALTVEVVGDGHYRCADCNRAYLE